MQIELALAAYLLRAGQRAAASRGGACASRQTLRRGVGEPVSGDRVPAHDGGPLPNGKLGQILFQCGFDAPIVAGKLANRPVRPIETPLRAEYVENLVDVRPELVRRPGPPWRR